MYDPQEKTAKERNIPIWQAVFQMHNEIMNIADLINSNANIAITVNLVDLKEWALSLIGEAQAAKQKKEETYLTADETASRIPCDKSTLWRWNKTGYLKSVKIGNKVRYRLSDIEKLLSKEEV